MISKRSLPGVVLAVGLLAAPLADAQSTVRYPASKITKLPFELDTGMGANDVARGERAPAEPRPRGSVLESRPALNPALKPAFREQTRAPAVHTRTRLIETVVASGLANPGGLVFLPNGRILLTERPGNLLVITRDGDIGPAIAGVPEVANFGYAGGLSDVALDPEFASNRRLFLSYMELRGEGAGLTLASATLSADESRLENLKVMLEGPVARNVAHVGGRILIGPDRKLYLAVGDRYTVANRIKSQSLDTLHGKVLRLNLDGTVPPDNPFAQLAGAQGLIWTFGIRNLSGLAVRPGTNEIWFSDHGPQGGDEINLLAAGHNYGWPVAAYGSEYSGKPINGGHTAWAGTDQPVYYWDPVIAPGGTTFYSGSLIPEWRGNLFVAALAGQHLARLVLRGNKVIGEERLLQGQKQRIRQVVQGLDGALWIVTDAANGRLIRLAPEGA